MSTVLEMAESHLDAYKDDGYEFVAVFTHAGRNDMMFVEAYKSWEHYNAARKYWNDNDYRVRKVWDLDYLDYLREHNDREPS